MRMELTRGAKIIQDKFREFVNYFTQPSFQCECVDLTSWDGLKLKNRTRCRISLELGQESLFTSASCHSRASIHMEHADRASPPPSSTRVGRNY